MELTALRTKVSDMYKEMATTEKNMRNEIRLDSEVLFTNVELINFCSCKFLIFFLLVCLQLQ